MILSHRASGAALGALLLAAPVAAGAAAVPTNLPGVTAKVGVPAGFDALAASPEALEANGFPPRPDAAADPQGFASWKRAVTAGTRRVVPKLTQTDIQHHPLHRLGRRDDTDYSNNWSGYVLLNQATAYGSKSWYYIIGDYTVPVAQQAFGACTGSYDYSSTWVGIDGYDNGDVLQAGTEADADCSGGTTTPFYAAWYEWYPYDEVRIDSFPVGPGDAMYVEVWSTSATAGEAYVVNYSTNQSTSIGFSAPAGTTLVGNSAEWIVERPGVNGGLATLTNYVQDFFEDATAANFKSAAGYPGKPGKNVTSTQVVMQDNNGTNISYPNLLGTSGLWFYDAESALYSGDP
jgi:hypothetical protein